MVPGLGVGGRRGLQAWETPIRTLPQSQHSALDNPKAIKGWGVGSNRANITYIAVFYRIGNTID